MAVKRRKHTKSGGAQVEEDRPAPGRSPEGPRGINAPHVNANLKTKKDRTALSGVEQLLDQYARFVGRSSSER